MKVPKLLIFLTYWLLARVDATKPPQQVECIPCDVLFSKLRGTPSSKKFQTTSIQLRGEPKSGTAMMYEWAEGSLYQACKFLNSLFGEGTCRVTWEAEDSRDPRKSSCTLEFQPSQSEKDSPCSCQDVDRWKYRWMLECGKLVENYNDVWRHMAEANCTITDYRSQLVVMRDPRPVAVSTFYHQRKNVYLFDENFEEYVLKILPTIYFCCGTHSLTSACADTIYRRGKTLRHLYVMIVVGL